MQRDADDVDVKPARRLSASLGSPARIDSDINSSTVTAKQLALSSLESILAPLKQAATSPALRKAAVSSGILAVIVALSLGSATFAYLIFYYLYVPRAGFSQEIWLQYGQGQTPFALVDLKRASLASDLVYDVVLDLVAPTSPRNIELGNFMVDLTLQAADGSTIIRSSRAASLAWTPPLVRFLKAILRLPAFLLFDFYSHSQSIRVPVITKKALRTFSTPRIATALVQVGRPGLDGTLPGELQIYSATLRFVAHLTGLRWLMYYHRIISFFLFCGIFFTISLLSALVLWAAAGYIYNKDAEESDGDTATTANPVKSEASNSDKAVPLLRRTSSSRASRENSTQRELQDQAHRLAQARKRGDALLQSGTDTEAEDDKGGILGHLQFGGVSVGSESENEAVIVKSENTSGGGSPNWQDVSFSGDNTLTSVEKEENAESTIAGGTQVKAEGQNSSTSARLARENSIRRRASNRSMKEQSVE